jgi:hypothetical protein
MLGAIRSRLTYANIVATVAVFLGLAGGAYALSGVPDRSGVFHGCASNKTGGLRVVKSASSCRRAKGHGKHRDPGESAVSWNQTGRPGANGRDGANGVDGGTGPQGPGATAFATTLPSDSAFYTLATVGGVRIRGACTGTNAELALGTSEGTLTLQASGTYGDGTTVVPSDRDGTTALLTSSTAISDLDVIARNNGVGNFMRLDLHGTGSTCHFWGMIIPTS